MRIAQIASVYLPIPPKTYGGTERVVFELCRNLARRGHEVELFASGDSQVDCRLHSVLPVASQDNPDSTVYLEKEFEARNAYALYRQAERFDVVHCHWPTLAPYFSNFTKTPTVITYAYIEKDLHDYYRQHFPSCIPVCVSRAQARLLGDESLAVVYNGVDVDQIGFVPDPGDFFVVVGRMTPGKGIAEAIRIARQAKIRLVIVGHVTSHLPWSEEYFKKEVQPHIDGDAIRHIERLSNARLIELMGQARGLLFPLQWDEPFGMVVLEAMAAGTPVLTYKRGAMPELVRHGETGFLLESETEMITALESLGSIDRARCRDWVRSQFSVERMVDGYEEIYRRAVRKF